jgi:CHRD domain-containing protein
VSKISLLRIAAVGLLTVTACGGGTEATTPTTRSSPLVATRDPTPAVQPPTLGTFVMVADLRSAAQVPPITDAEASCTGQAEFVLRAKLDPAGKITGATAQFSFFVNTCPASTKVTLTHIHQGPPGQNGIAKIDSGLTATEPMAVRGGEIGFNVQDVVVADLALVTDIIANPASYYMDVHSVQHPDGLLRGQLAHRN